VPGSPRFIVQRWHYFPAIAASGLGSCYEPSFFPLLTGEAGRHQQQATMESVGIIAARIHF